jgi:hypothetical protein
MVHVPRQLFYSREQTNAEDETKKKHNPTLRRVYVERVLLRDVTSELYLLGFIVVVVNALSPEFVTTIFTDGTLTSRTSTLYLSALGTKGRTDQG